MPVLRRFAIVAVLSGALLASTLSALAFHARGFLAAGAADPDTLDLLPLSERSLVLGRDGSVLTVLHAEENRVHLPLDDVPDHTVDAVLAVEDEDFFAHGGVNLRAAVRAFLTNVSAGDVRQGGSTITQQLVKNSLLTPERDLDRKVREAVLAMQLEDEMTKEDILERYLNTVYFGNGAYGLQAAAEVYWGVDAGDLDMAQSALLAAVIRNPVGYDPIAFPEVAGARRDLVADRLVELGHLDDDGAAAIRAAPLPTARHEMPRGPGDYFIEEVKRRLLADRRLGDTPQARYNALFRGGLRIQTTLDPALQHIAGDAVANGLPDTGGEFTAALVAVEPATGAVRALVGGPDFDRAKYNLATQGIGRQPGSSFKPFVLAAALEAGYSPADRISASSPCHFRPTSESPWLIEPWEVSNYAGAGGGTVTLTSATHRSLNCAYARLVMLVGPERVAELGRRMGITTPLDPVAAIALGAEEVRPVDMAAAYATFANDGVHHEPYLVEAVTDRDGEVLLEGATRGRRAVSEDVARTVTQVLQGVVRQGTGTAARFRGHDIAGKTGTTQNWEDAWFVGYTGHLSTAVWMGSPVGKVSMRNVGGIRVTGGSYPARIWRAFMEPSHAFATPIDFVAPERVARGGAYLQPEGERRYRPRSRPVARRTSEPSRSDDSSTRNDTEGTTATTDPPTTDTTPTTVATDPSSGDGRGVGGGGGGEGGGDHPSG